MQATVRQVARARLCLPPTPPASIVRYDLQHFAFSTSLPCAASAKGKKHRDDKGKRRAQQDTDHVPSLPDLESEYGVHLDRASAHRTEFMTLAGDRDYRQGEQLDLESLKANLDQAIQKLRTDLKPVMGQLSTAMPTCRSRR
jgi:hypothetical protein